MRHTWVEVDDMRKGGHTRTCSACGVRQQRTQRTEWMRNVGGKFWYPRMADIGPCPGSERTKTAAVSRPWFVYVLHSPSTDDFYVGVTTDPDRRLEEHNGKGKKGARRTRKGRPWERVYVEVAVDMVAAMKREYRVKRLHRPAKLKLIAEGRPCPVNGMVDATTRVEPSVAPSPRSKKARGSPVVS